MTRPSSDSVVTPEAIALSVDVAGIGSRMIASVIDTAIQAALAALAFLIFIPAFSALDLSGSAGTVALFAAVFLVVWGYYPFCEGLFHGVTPGKRTQRLRVIQADGQPAKLGAILVRNLLRIVDFLPAYYAAGALTMIFTKRSQRIGDLIAGTIVVRDRRAPAPAPFTLPAEHAPQPGTPPIDVSGITEREYAVVRSFLQRRVALEPGARADLARNLAATIRARLGPGAEHPTDDEVFLERVALAYRARFSAPDA